MKEFVIPFFGLKIGIHEFKFEIGKSFFEAFDNSLLTDGSFSVHLVLEKSTNMLKLEFKAKGMMHDYCDRCGDPLDLKYTTKDRLFVKFGDEPFEQTDEILVVTHDTHEIDVSQSIYEMLVLGIPRKRVHSRNADCNQTVLAKLRELESKEEYPVDPRWEQLNKLK